MNSRDIIIICATVIILLGIGMFIMANPFGSGETSILTMESDQSLSEGDSLVLKLSDENKTAIAGQRIEINLTHASNGVTENFTLKTNDNGECRLEDLIADNFTLSAKFNGNKDYKPATLSGTIYVKKKSNAKSLSSSSGKYKTDNKVDDVIDGWDPSEHEVSREDLGDGTYRITYDDGYFRIVDEDGNILTYGY
ncbi:MAG: carboxypeptidase regulatory-like domain-containing protein [Methanobrevibacter olleyae]|uniref:Carboxypeptidase regulatory-like domain-containing protein n=1 Tax=Methanobrevibacter olleyae TaxID=294671 RepID=A0A8T3VQI7_METOL|nr:carboxypeptidase regulatory-like domain-containing protein [Methanobrevibacter olleyae]